MQNLPIGIQTFEKIISNDFLYVDKTELIYQLISTGGFYFLSRPRRFGKSLLVSTLKEIFCGNKELFKGLYIYNKINWEKHPVVHISFSSITYSGSSTDFRSKIVDYLYTIAKVYNVTLTTSSISETFKELLLNLCEINKVVILIDEYDKPIIDYINNLDKAKENRDVLREFYGSIKDNDQYIKFCFLTGVSKFSKVSVFSGLNNLRDITINDTFSNICGITQKELEFYFFNRFNDLEKKLNLDYEKLKQKIKHWYNGYSWDGVNTVYNPFSILNFFADGQFKNYWFSTGTPAFLMDKIKDEKIQVDEIESDRVGLEIFESYDLDNINFASLLFQTGYLNC
ncbi:MAG: AAA family ATPase [bacterium]